MKILLKVIIIFAAFLVFSLVVYFAFPHFEGKKPGAVATSTPGMGDLIVIDSPKPSDVITSPLSISGQARGKWYFEGSFPVQILDAGGNVLGKGIATAQSDWMSENFVPFTGSIVFTPSKTESGEIVFKKDNPSGLPSNDAEVHIPIYFTQPSPVMKVNVFFGNSNYGSKDNCTNVFPVARIIPKTTEVGKAALLELLKGPTSEEIAQGYFTTINEGVTLQKLSIVNGIAFADFDQTLQKAVGGSCRVGSIRAEIVSTLEQFSSVKEVNISINSFTEGVLEP